MTVSNFRNAKHRLSPFFKFQPPLELFSTSFLCSFLLYFDMSRGSRKPYEVSSEISFVDGGTDRWDSVLHLQGLTEESGFMTRLLGSMLTLKLLNPTRGWC